MDNRSSYQDCYYTYDPHSQLLQIGNSRVYRNFYFIHDQLFSGEFGLAPTKDSFGQQQLVKTFNLKMLPEEPCSPFTISTQVYSPPGAASGHSGEFQVSLEQAAGALSIRFTIALLPGRSFIRSFLQLRGPARRSSPEPARVDKNLLYGGIESDHRQSETYLLPPPDTVDAVPHSIRHGRLKRISLYDDTDRNDYLLEEIESDLYGRYGREYTGNIFVARDSLSDSALLLLKEAPTAHGALHRQCSELYWHQDGYCALRGTGIDPSELQPQDYLQAYGATFGIGTAIEEELRDYLRASGPHTGLRPFALANTWGDRNKDTALNSKFIQAELLAAAEIGVDYLQIDDGWQTGITKNSGLVDGGVWEGYYQTDPNFWQVNPHKFPQGLAPLAEQARNLDVKLALWFSPDSSHSFANWHRDAQVVLDFYHQCGIDQFKFDGIKIRDKPGEENLVRFLRTIESKSNGNIDYCMDVTAEIRFAYLYRREHGKIFLENRYTDWTNYFPYRTLRNIWMLCRYMPIQRFQVEVLNNRRNRHLYGEDPFAPSHYSMDYLFAIAMPAIPLFFMELTGLPAEARAELEEIMRVYTQIRDELYYTQVIPIGDRPDGRAFSGFQCVINETSGFLILFRDNSPQKSYDFSLAAPIGATQKNCVLCTNGIVKIEIKYDRLAQFTAESPRTYAIISY